MLSGSAAKSFFVSGMCRRMCIYRLSLEGKFRMLVFYQGLVFSGVATLGLGKQGRKASHQETNDPGKSKLHVKGAEEVNVQ